MSRREASGWVAKICGGATAATALLAACSSGGGSGASAPTSRPTRAAGADTTPPTGGGTGHALSVAADDPDVRATAVSFAGPAGAIQGYLAVPATGRDAPGIVVDR